MKVGIDVRDMSSILGFIKGTVGGIDLSIEINSRIVTEVVSRLAIAAHIEGRDDVRDEAIKLLRSIHEYVMSKGSRYSRVYSLVMLANALARTDHTDEVRELMSNINELVEGLEGLSGVTALADIAEVMYKCGLVRYGRNLLLKGESLARGLDDLEERVWGLSYVSLVASLTRELPIALRTIKEAIKTAKALGKALSGRLVEELSNAIAELCKAGAVDEAAEVSRELISLISSFADMEHYLPVLEALGSVELVSKDRVREVLNALLANAEESIPKNTGNPAFEVSMKLFHYITIARVAAKVGLINYSLNLLTLLKEVIRDMEVVGSGDAEALSTMVIPIIPHLPVIAEVVGSKGLIKEAEEVLSMALNVANKASTESYIARVIGPEVIEASKGLTYIGIVRAAGKLGMYELVHKALSKVGEVGVALMAISSLLAAKYGL